MEVRANSQTNGAARVAAATRELMRARTDVSSADRIAGAILVAAAGLILAGALIGALAPSLRDAPWSDDPQLLIQAIAGNPNAFVWANALFLAAAVLTALALVAIADRFDGRARPWALMGSSAFFLAAVFEVFDRLVSIRIYPWAAQHGVDVTSLTAQSFIRLDDALAGSFHTLGFIAIALFGVAMATGATHRRFGLLLAAGGAIGLLLQGVGAVIPAFVFLGTAALGIVVSRNGVRA